MLPFLFSLVPAVHAGPVVPLPHTVQTQKITWSTDTDVDFDICYWTHKGQCPFLWKFNQREQQDQLVFCLVTLIWSRPPPLNCRPIDPHAVWAVQRCETTEKDQMVNSHHFPHPWKFWNTQLYKVIFDVSIQRNVASVGANQDTHSGASSWAEGVTARVGCSTQWDPMSQTLLLINSWWGE